MTVADMQIELGRSGTDKHQLDLREQLPSWVLVTGCYPHQSWPPTSPQPSCVVAVNMSQLCGGALALGHDPSPLWDGWQENDAKRHRALRKASGERLQAARSNVEAIHLRQEIARLLRERDKLQRRLEANDIFRSYLQTVIEKTEQVRWTLLCREQ